MKAYLTELSLQISKSLIIFVEDFEYILIKMEHACNFVSAFISLEQMVKDDGRDKYMSYFHGMIPGKSRNYEER